MKSKIICLSAILLVATVVAFSQQPPQEPGPPPHAQQPGPPPQAPRPGQYGPRPAGMPSPQGEPRQPGQPPQGPPLPPDPIAGNLFPPELVMQHRRELGLTDEQKAAIRDESIKASTRFNELQWQMQDEIETMATLMKATPVDEQRALAQLDRVLNIEREVKRTQLGLSIRIKNKLTSEQQMKLHELQQNPHPQR
jgi:Spy/CpxP family protein refolding chaperone